MAERTARSYRWLILVLALTGVAVDQASKYAVFPWLHRAGVADERGGKYYEVIPGAFRLRVMFSDEKVQAGDGVLGKLQAWNGPEMPYVNRGALFGIFDGYELTANTAFAAISLIAAAAIVYWTFRRSTARDWFLCTALGLILGGTLGNLFDRVVFGGVRDFLYWHGGFEWPVFNLADCCLVCGACLLLVQAVWSWRAPAAEKEATQVAMASSEAVEAK